MDDEKLFVAIQDPEYPIVWHVMMTETYAPDEPHELVMQEIYKLWNRDFYQDEAEIIAGHLNAAVDEIRALSAAEAE